jgi:hypothetical protein
MRRCAHCKYKHEPADMIQVGLRLVCGQECRAAVNLKTFEKSIKVKRVEFNRETKRRKVAAEGSKELFPRLQMLVNQWVLHVRDAGKPCCTCGTTNPNIKYDAGHYISRGSSPELRFELTNIHKQCNQICNIYGSGKRAEYDKFIMATYGESRFDLLKGPHRKLKEQFPHADDIRAEIERYKGIIKGAGLVPRH